MSDPIVPATQNTALAIFIHGYGTDHSYFDTQEINQHSYPFPWARITFYDAPKKRGLFWWTNFNMGQRGDAAQIISFLWDIQRNGYKKLVSMAHSRGGAAWISALHMVWFPEDHPKFWKKFSRKLHIPQTTIIARLQNLLQETTSILVHPLLSINSAAHCTFKRKYHLSSFSSNIFVAAYRTSLSICSSYSLLFPEAIELLDELIETKKFIGKILLCQHDKIVGNEFDQLLIHRSYPPQYQAYHTNAPNHFCLKAGYLEVQAHLGNESISQTDACSEVL
ncbi:MAG: hypothetical protein A2017_20400 [Lentisphaerae bacterium GWF2_44_16]|nr:MAG: hypothetical protein A2017_20400 [Lentisphaerae bacterium GWF2_44_16]